MPTSTILDKRAVDCRLGTGDGVTITFAATTIPDGISADHTTLCNLASEAAARQKDTTRSQLANMCRTYSPLLRRLGTDDFEVAAETLQNSVAEPDAATKQAISIFYECAHKDAAVKMANSGISIRIYSVGSLKSLTRVGSTCLGYLEEMSGMKEAGGSTSYFLFGTGDCAKRDYQNKKLSFHPEANPSGRPPGDVMRSLYAYTGPLPTEWTYKGVRYPFGGGNTQNNHTPGVAPVRPTEVATMDSSSEELDDNLAQQKVAHAFAATHTAQEVAAAWCTERGQALDQCVMYEQYVQTSPTK